MVPESLSSCKAIQIHRTYMFCTQNDEVLNPCVISTFVLIDEYSDHFLRSPTYFPHSNAQHQNKYLLAVFKKFRFQLRDKVYFLAIISEKILSEYCQMHLINLESKLRILELTFLKQRQIWISYKCRQGLKTICSICFHFLKAWETRNPTALTLFHSP